MSEKPTPDWNPRAEAVLRDQRAAYDAMRERCPVAYSDLMGWSVFRHADVMRILHDPVTFSSAVSEHLSVPSGMDTPEHTAYRGIVEKYFSAEYLAAFEPHCIRLVDELLRHAIEQGEVEFMDTFALPFVARAQCAFLGWTEEFEQPLIRWAKKNQAATLAQDRKAMSEIAREFEGLIDDLLESRVESGARPEDDITASLMHDKVWRRTLSNEEIASILRNWTVGEIGTLSASIGILAQFLAEHADIQAQLRADLSLVPAAIDEILRIHGPLVANRRVTTTPVEIGGRQIDADQRISINWVSANRDGRVFADPDTFRLDRDPSQNLLYGAGLHVCPGAPLARQEMRIYLEELLKRTTSIQLIPSRPATLAVYPASGYAQLPLALVARL